MQNYGEQRLQTMVVLCNGRSPVESPGTGSERFSRLASAHIFCIVVEVENFI